MPVCGHQPLDSHTDPFLAPPAAACRPAEHIWLRKLSGLTWQAQHTAQHRCSSASVGGTKAMKRDHRGMPFPTLQQLQLPAALRQAPASSLSTPPKRLSLGLATHTPSAWPPAQRGGWSWGRSCTILESGPSPTRWALGEGLVVVSRGAHPPGQGLLGCAEQHGWRARPGSAKARKAQWGSLCLGLRVALGELSVLSKTF